MADFCFSYAIFMIALKSNARKIEEKKIITVLLRDKCMRNLCQ